MVKKKKKKAPRRKAKTAGPFSFVALHNKMDETLMRLRERSPSPKRDELIRLVKEMRAVQLCPEQLMLVDL